MDCKARNLREGTIHHYQESIKQIYKRIPPDTPISSMNKQTMADFYIALREDPDLNEVTMGTYARDLKTLMRFFMKCQYIPHFEIQLPKADKAPIQTYTDDELRKLLKKPDVRKCIFSTYRSWVIVNFLMNCGCRASSVRNIQNRDVDLDTKQIIFRHNKNGKIQTVPLCSVMVSILREYMAVRRGKPEDYLFCDQYGGMLSMNGLRLAVARHNQSRGVEKTSTHLYRHTFARKYLVDCGGDAFMLPEYTDECGITYRPCQYFDKVELVECEDGANIVAEGYMSITETSVPKRSDVRFKLTFNVKGENISMRAETDKPMASAVMVTGASEGGAKVSAVGFDVTEEVDSYGKDDFRGIHGWIVGVKRHSVSAPKVLGYDMKI